MSGRADGKVAIQVHVPRELLDRIEQAARDRLFGRALLMEKLLEIGLDSLPDVPTILRPRQPPVQDAARPFHRAWSDE